MRRRTIGWILIGAGVVAFFAAGFVGGRTVWRQIFAPTYDVPATLRLDLSGGRYVVYEQTGRSTGYGPVTVGRNDGVTLVPTDLRVIAPGGRNVAVDGRDTNMTISRNGDVFTSVLEFRAPVRGQYVLRFENPYPRRVMVGRSLASVFIGLIPWAVGALAGLGLVAGGIVLVILGRTRAARPTIAAGGVPAQWATDPYGAHRLRYWDGATWTEHVAD